MRKKNERKSLALYFYQKKNHKNVGKLDND